MAIIPDKAGDYQGISMSILLLYYHKIPTNKIETETR